MIGGRATRCAGMVWILGLLLCGARTAFAQEARASEEARAEERERGAAPEGRFRVDISWGTWDELPRLRCPPGNRLAS